MKKRKFLVCLLSVIISIYSFIVPVSADFNNEDEYCESFDFTFEHNVTLDGVTANAKSTVGPCTHYGTIYMTNITTSNDVQTKYMATVTHKKASVNSCTHMMDWTIEFVMFAESSGVILHPPRTRTGTLAIGLSNVEVFAGPSGAIFEYRLVTSVAGVTDQTEWKRIKF